MDLLCGLFEKFIDFWEGERIEPQSYDGIGNVDTSHSSDLDKSKGAEAYVTSVRTVAFWVSISWLNWNC